MYYMNVVLKLLNYHATIALLTLLIGNTFYARNIVASVLVMVWAVRIAGDITA